MIECEIQLKSNTMQIETPRLILRQWKLQDLAAFNAMNKDPEVMRYYPRILTTAESELMFNKLRSLINEKGWGFWAVESKQDAGLVGLLGLNEPIYKLPVTPCVEIGWRFAKYYWRQGLATEAARACLHYGFEKLSLHNIYAFTSEINTPSQRLMQRLGMQDMRQNFDHPIIPDDSSLKEHVLYRIKKTDWQALTA